VDDSNNALICDFGRGKVIGDAEYSTALVAGLANHRAPELWSEDDINIDQLFSPASDVYAFGMLAFQVLSYLTRFVFAHFGPQMFTDEVPFSGLDQLEFRIWASVRRGDRPLRSSDTHHRISDNMWAIIQGCWVSNPIARPMASVIVEWIG
jgi:serine/threonine protein kinase